MISLGYRISVAITVTASRRTSRVAVSVKKRFFNEMSGRLAAINPQLWVLGVFLLIGVDDFLDQFVADHIPLGEEDKSDAVYVGKQLFGLNQPGGPVLGQIALGDIPGD